MLKPAVVAYSTVPGGAEAYLTRLYRALKDGGNSPVMVGSLPRWEDAGLQRVPLALSAKWGGATIAAGALKLPSERRRLFGTIADLGPDFFHVQFKREQIGFTDLLSRQAPVVWTEHGRFLRGPKGALLAAGYKYAAQMAAVIVCVSEEVAADVRRVVGPGPRIEVIENSVDTTTLRRASEAEKMQARVALGIPTDKPVLLWIGRLHEGKRAGFAVDIAAAWPGFTLIAGDGPMRRRIEGLAKSIPRAQVLGHIDDTEMLYHAADVMAFTSTGAGEGYPTTTMVEAGAHGVPIVTDGRSGAGRVVLASGGRVLPADATPHEWVQAIHSSISEDRARKAREWAEEHDVQSWAEKHLDVFKSVI